jgi:hypothetical protein
MLPILFITGDENFCKSKKFWEELFFLLYLEPNLVELNLSEITSFNLTHVNQIYCSKQLGCHG